MTTAPLTVPVGALVAGRIPARPDVARAIHELEALRAEVTGAYYASGVLEALDARLASLRREARR